MKRFGYVLALGAALCAGAILSGTAQAVPVSPLGLSIANLNPVEKTQLFIFGGRHYCFYLDGWHGPGWYWCGYEFRRGFGWGGPEGWHGWYRRGHGFHGNRGGHEMRGGVGMGHGGHGGMGHGGMGHGGMGHGGGGHGGGGHGGHH